MQIYVTREVVGERPISEVIEAAWFEVTEAVLKFNRVGQDTSEFIPLARIYHIAVRY